MQPQPPLSPHEDEFATGGLQFTVGLMCLVGGTSLFLFLKSLDEPMKWDGSQMLPLLAAALLIVGAILLIKGILKVKKHIL